ncbi:hypothetical protein BROUX41_001760 [Berkeleyomyces rouxiae]|uniref:uncharacterized protein n=1 Tax=Berkeleyomyces rouxiae TaxID=2035830 RepID=UPI003B7B5ACD
MPKFSRISRRNKPLGPVHPVPNSEFESTSSSKPKTICNDSNTYGEAGSGRQFDFTFDSGPIWGTSKGFRLFSQNERFLGPNMDTQLSLSESTLNFPEEFGRTYPAFRPGSYPYPNDPIETRRLDRQYHILNEVSGGRIHLAPWTLQQPPSNVLDIATGTGIWAMDIADLYPNTQIQGNDLSPIQPKQVPPNVHFFVEDAEDEWGFAQPFDYIHTRCCLGSFKNFKRNIIQQAFDNLSPGGWFEIQEIQHQAFCDDGTLSPSSPLAFWCRELQEASECLDRQIVIAPYLRQWYEEIGFVDVQEVVYKIPLNTWPRDPKHKAIGSKWERVLLDGLSGFSLALFNRHFARSREEIEASLVGVRRDISDPRIHAYHQYHVVIGRKPLLGRPHAV